MTNADHFFASRAHGEDKSLPKTSWRYGKGNVFAPSASHPEAAHAYANVDAILQEFKIGNTHPGVLLQSAYGKGISVVDQEFLRDESHSRDPSGRIIINGDGLFTTLTTVPLLNKSGDASAIIFESNLAIGILVGAWMCLSKDIINLMLDHFTKLNIAYDKITVHVGPGLGKTSFGMGKPPLEQLKKVFEESLDLAVTSKTNKHNQIKYFLDVHTLMQKYAEFFGFIVNLSESVDTFDKTAWKKVKAEALEKNDPLLPINYYKSCKFFSARLYVRVDRLARRIANKAGLPLPEQLVEIGAEVDPEDIKNASKYRRYDETGRCLNGVIRKPNNPEEKPVARMQKS